MGLFRSTRYDFPVIGVGNLRVGGTGKTPMVEYLIRLLGDRYHMAMLSRGYGRKTEGFRLVQPGDSSLQVGDEPAQVKTKFPEVLVGVDGNRVRGIAKLRSHKPEMNMLVLDDVLQHRAVKPGLMIMLTSYHQLYLDDLVLPAGRLREPKSAVYRADIVVVTKCPPNITPVEKRGIQDRINPKPYQEVFFAYEKYSTLRAFGDTPTKVPLNSRVLLLTGIAGAAGLKEHVDKTMKLGKHLSFGDHHAYTSRDVEHVVAEFDAMEGDQKIVLTTEKDAQRLMAYQQNEKFAKLPVYVQPMEIQFFEGYEEAFNEAIHEYIRSYSTVGSVHS